MPDDVLNIINSFNEPIELVQNSGLMRFKSKVSPWSLVNKSFLKSLQINLKTGYFVQVVFDGHTCSQRLTWFFKTQACDFNEAVENANRCIHDVEFFWWPNFHMGTDIKWTRENGCKMKKNIHGINSWLFFSSPINYPQFPNYLDEILFNDTESDDEIDYP